jgi:hypothetical protein
MTFQISCTDIPARDRLARACVRSCRRSPSDRASHGPCAHPRHRSAATPLYKTSTHLGASSRRFCPRSCALSCVEDRCWRAPSSCAISALGKSCGPNHWGHNRSLVSIMSGRAIQGRFRLASFYLQLVCRGRNGNLVPQFGAGFTDFSR